MTAQPKTFPQRSLNESLEISSPADPQDVLDVKIYLYQKGLYDIPDYGLTPYPDTQMFAAIKDYQEKYKIDPYILFPPTNPIDPAWLKTRKDREI